NPSSIELVLNDVIDNNQDSDEWILNMGNIFYSYKCHSSIYSNDEKELVKKIRKIKQSAHQSLIVCDYLFITLGSAFVYEHKDLNATVTNCHKQSSSLFEKRLLSVEEIVFNYRLLIQKLRVFNPRISIIITVSPVKYLKDGLVENNISKSTLLLAANTLENDGLVDYFPAYELVNDDLRDYRFYKEDMAHPNEQAIKYVWDKFNGTFFGEDTLTLNKEIEKLNAALNHKILFPESEEAMAFQMNTEKMKRDLMKRHPYLKFF
ncbi:MAG: GSCFA domain-containing protein, partial [Bacteroidia bacterium]|nr:GSCFA domain-containing protein [Bacteroidia bacterium]